MALRFTDNIKPREPNSPASAIENRADADSDSGFTRLCFVRHKGGIYAICCLVPIRDTHKSPTNCLPECGHDPWSAPNLERHGSSKMQPFGWLEMPYFLNRIFHLYFHMKSPSVFLIILLIKAKHGRELFVCINVARGL